jgi:hypothetical protein
VTANDIALLIGLLALAWLSGYGYGYARGRGIRDEPTHKDKK